MELDAQHLITDTAQLEALYAAPSPLVSRKVMTRLDSYLKALVTAAPFVCLATVGTTTGLDCSPRGDEAGFVQVADDTTLLIPDRPGNNRIDSLRNIVADSRVGLLFLFPGVNEALRINGRAQISTDSRLLERFGHAPKVVIALQIEEAFMHCARAVSKGGLWNTERWLSRQQLPNFAAMLSAQTGIAITDDDL